MIRILLADDHTIVREGLKQIISGSDNMTIVGEAPTGRDLIDLARKTVCDVILLDISLPDMVGIDVLNQLSIEKIRTPVLFLSMHPEEQYGFRALEAGAAGYLTKGADREEIIKAIVKVAGGGKYISPSMAELMAYHMDQNSQKSPHQRLSNREFEVMRYLGVGKSTSEIATHLNVSVKTVSTYRSRILDKMKMKNTAQVMSYAIKEGLVD